MSRTLGITGDKEQAAPSVTLSTAQYPNSLMPEYLPHGCEQAGKTDCTLAQNVMSGTLSI
jgi:hypothetical protein